METKKLGRRPTGGIGFSDPITIRLEIRHLDAIKSHTDNISEFIRTSVKEKLKRMKENK